MWKKFGVLFFLVDVMSVCLTVAFVSIPAVNGEQGVLVGVAFLSEVSGYTIGLSIRKTLFSLAATPRSQRSMPKLMSKEFLSLD